jgi:hypothetical protein
LWESIQPSKRIVPGSLIQYGKAPISVKPLFRNAQEKEVCAALTENFSANPERKVRVKLYFYEQFNKVDDGFAFS